MEKVEQFSRAGSLRRLSETVRDLDFIIATTEPKRVGEQLVSLTNVSKIIAQGETKVSVEITEEVPVSVDFRLVTAAEFATTLHHFTGSKDHNVLMRQLAKARGEKISEYGVENLESSQVTTFKSEADFFRAFPAPFYTSGSTRESG